MTEITAGPPYEPTGTDEETIGARKNISIKAVTTVLTMTTFLRLMSQSVSLKGCKVLLMRTDYDFGGVGQRGSQSERGGRTPARLARRLLRNTTHAMAAIGIMFIIRIRCCIYVTVRVGCLILESLLRSFAVGHCSRLVRGRASLICSAKH